MNYKYICLMSLPITLLMQSPSLWADNTPQQCLKVEQAYNDAIMYSVNRQAQLAKEELPLLSVINKLDASVKDQKKPVGEQFTAEQKDEFERARTQILYLEYAQFIASSRERDLSVIFNLCLASAHSEQLMDDYLSEHGQLDDNYPSWVKAQYKKSKDVQYLNVLDFLQGMFPSEMTKQMQQAQEVLKAAHIKQ